MAKYISVFWILIFISLVACIQTKTACQTCQSTLQPEVFYPDDVADDTPLLPTQPDIAPPDSLQPVQQIPTDSMPVLCELTPPIKTVLRQDNSAWCWAATATMVINHLEPDRVLRQCITTQTTLEPEIAEFIANKVEQGEDPADLVIDCCLVTDANMKDFDPDNPTRPGDKYIPYSVQVCHTTGRPEWALDANGYEGRYNALQWPNNGSKGLKWDDITGQICSNRPFIAERLFLDDDGQPDGQHVETVTGYRIIPDAWINMDTHGMDSFFSMPYDDYLGKPGKWIHIGDIVDIGL